MLERVARDAARFRLPGLVSDERGVAIGVRGLALFSSLDRLVTFVRAAAEEGLLGELVPSSEILRIVTPLRATELAFLFDAESSYRMDRASSLAALARGTLFTGTARHFVRYRDARSPLGYDVASLVDDAADLLLYDSHTAQSYSRERPISLRELVLSLSPVRVPGARPAAPEPATLVVEPGLFDAIAGHLLRSRVEASVARVERPRDSAFDDAPPWFAVFEASALPPRLFALYGDMPGVHVFVPVIDGVGVEAAHRHPVALAGCKRLFDERDLHLFRADGVVVSLSPRPSLVSIESIVRVARPADAPRMLRLEPSPPADDPLVIDVTVSAASTDASSRDVTAVRVRHEDAAGIAPLVRMLPPWVFDGLRVAVANGEYFFLDRRGVEGLPVGVALAEIASNVYCPIGHRLVPRLGASALEAYLGHGPDEHVFLSVDGPAVSLPDAAFVPVTRRLLRRIEPRRATADVVATPEPELPYLAYAPHGGAERDGEEPAR